MGVIPTQNRDTKFDIAAYSNTKIDLLDWALSLLQESPLAQELIADAEADGWTIEIDQYEGHDFNLDVPRKIITINTNTMNEAAIARSPYFSSIFVTTLARALRDVWQEKRNGGFDHDFKPEDILTLERIRAADLDCMTILMAWELRCAGEGKLWRHILGSDNSDIAMRFAAIADHNINDLPIQTALAASFKQWFVSKDRIDNCDHETLEMMDEILKDSNFQNPFGRMALKDSHIYRLSCLPDKTSYLQYDAIDIITNPLYSGMNDEMNQLHFMHIIRDTQVTYVQNVPFQDKKLAMRVFPNGMMSVED